jgi:5-methylcytosine-specific restriction endonuclease McrA
MKVRCLNCREYVPKDTAKQVGLSYVCGDNCKADLRAKTIVRQRTAHGRTNGSERRTDGIVPQAVREHVLKRDAYRCRFCGQSNNHLHVHHIVYRSQGGPHEGWNLITLCDEHHALVHSNKRRYMPLLRGVIWLMYVERKRYLVPQLERSLGT